MKFALLLICFFTPVAALAQAAGKMEWVRVTSPKADVALSMPAGFLVVNDGNDLRIISSRGGATLNFQVWREGDPKRRLEDRRRWLQNPENSGKHERFKIGSFLGDSVVHHEKKYSIQLYLASEKGYYHVGAVAETSDHPVLFEFLRSIRLDGLPLLKQDNPAAYTEAAVQLHKLESSPEVSAALKRPDAREVRIVYDSNILPVDNPAMSDLTRPAVILRRPHARYTDAARSRGVEGSVSLRIQLRADGTIGEVIVKRGLVRGLMEAAVDAAKKIKFLPAEKDGLPVDSYVTIEYSFDIY